MPDAATPELDPVRAVSNLRVEMTGDWYRDPWGWPEYEFLLDGNLGWLTERVKARELKRVVKIDVPKENFGIRPAVVIEPLDRLLYQSLVDSISEQLIADLAPWVHGWRLPRSSPAAQIYSPNDTEWSLYRRHLKAGALFCDCGLKTDIVSCFASIPVGRVCEDITRKAGDNDVTARLIRMLQGFDSIQGRAGLAQRSTASSVLANMYMERFRYVLNDHAEREESVFQATAGVQPVLRWMDDIWMFGDDEAQLRSLQVDLQGATREAGLELNLGKTKLLAEESLWEAVSHLEHSAVDAAIDIDPPDITPLEALLDEIIESPENADRTSIRFAMTRMRRQQLRTRLDKLVEVTPRMPHGADHIARAFRDFEIWRTHRDWFLEYVHSSWSKISWSVAQLGTMFPSQTQPSDNVKSKFAEFVLDRRDFPLMALAVQRMASWDPAMARDLLHEVVKVADHPQERRIIALAAVAAGEESDFVRRVLGEYEENRLTLATLEARGFTSIPPVPDFGAD